MSRYLIRLSIGMFVGVAGCGGGGDPGGVSNAPVLTTLVISPTEGSLPNTPPGNALALAVTAKDQKGTTMVNAGTVSFSSNNTSVASVNGIGVVTSHAVGNATITASLTVGSVTRTATATINVAVPPAVATVTAPLTTYTPSEVHITSGGTITWTMTGIPHTVTFTSPGSPNSIGELRNESAARTFPDGGTFPYECAIHAGMRGTVYVH